MNADIDHPAPGARRPRFSETTFRRISLAAVIGMASGGILLLVAVLRLIPDSPFNYLIGFGLFWLSYLVDVIAQHWQRRQFVEREMARGATLADANERWKRRPLRVKPG